MPKYTSRATLAHSPMGSPLFRNSGTCRKDCPMPTDMTDITDSDSSAALKLSQRPNLAASSAAIKNVLSPISDTNIREKAAGKPDLPSCDLAMYSCTTHRLVQLVCLDMPAA
jgi:hypothetical protein